MECICVYPSWPPTPCQRYFSTCESTDHGSVIRSSPAWVTFQDRTFIKIKNIRAYLERGEPNTIISNQIISIISNKEQPSSSCSHAWSSHKVKINLSNLIRKIFYLDKLKLSIRVDKKSNVQLFLEIYDLQSMSSYKNS